MSKESEVCTKCGKPKESPSGGSITQWISVCRCQALEPLPSDAPAIQICARCGKRIFSEGRDGSFTQFIFRHDSCACEQPQPVHRQIEPSPEDGARAQSVQSMHDADQEEVELELDAESFPVDRYKPLACLGTGAGGTVYLARDRLLKTKVAVKILRVLRQEQLISFHEEAKATSKLSHPNIISIRDFGATESGVPFMVLEYAPASSLEQNLKLNGPLDWKEALDTLSQVAEALAYSHEQGIFHRDLKPSNVLISAHESQVKLIDFGIAKAKSEAQELTNEQGNTLVGTPAYMSPDQAGGKPFDERSEIYSFGCVLFESLVGVPPFAGDSPLETISMQANVQPPLLSEVSNANIPVQIEEIVSTCLAKDPLYRYENMEELLAALRAAAGTVEYEEASQLEPSVREESEPINDARFGKAALAAASILVSLVTIWGVATIALKEKSGDFSAGKQENATLGTIPVGKDDFVSMTRVGGKADWVRFGKEERPSFRFLQMVLLPDDLDFPARNNACVLEILGSKIAGPPVFEKIGRIRSLKALRFKSCSGISRECIAVLVETINKTGGQLQEFGAFDCKLGPGSVALLARLEYLDYISLRQTTMKDDDIEQLRNPRLRIVDLGYNLVTDRSLDHLASLKSLKTLTVTEGLGITASGLKRFRQRRPDCRLRKTDTRKMQRSFDQTLDLQSAVDMMEKSTGK